MGLWLKASDKDAIQACKGNIVFLNNTECSFVVACGCTSASFAERAAPLRTACV